MNARSRLLAIATALAIAAPAALAQTPAGEPPVTQTGPASEASPLFRRHHSMAGIMKRMVEEMSAMQAEMDKGEPTPEARHAMARKMKEMSALMRRMSGLADRSTMSSAEARRQAEEMERQMDAMAKSPAMKEAPR